MLGFLSWSRIQDFLIHKHSGICCDCGNHSGWESRWQNADDKPLRDPIIVDDLVLLCPQCYGNRPL